MKLTNMPRKCVRRSRKPVWGSRKRKTKYREEPDPDPLTQKMYVFKYEYYDKNGPGKHLICLGNDSGGPGNVSGGPGNVS